MILSFEVISLIEYAQILELTDNFMLSIRQRLGVRARLSLPHRNGGGYQVIFQP